MAKELDNSTSNYLPARQEELLCANFNNEFVAETDVCINKGEGSIGENSLHKINNIIDENRAYYRFLSKNSSDAEDLEQEIKFKFFTKFKENPKWSEDIINPRAYLIKVARNIVINTRKKHCEKYESLDDKDIVKSNYFSDNGKSAIEIERNLDFAYIRKQMGKIIETFSQYEKILIQLSFFEGCKPLQVAEILLSRNHEILKSEFPEYSSLPKEEFEKIIKEYVPKDSNAVKAKLRYRLKSSLKAEYESLTA